MPLPERGRELPTPFTVASMLPCGCHNLLGCGDTNIKMVLLASGLEIVNDLEIGQINPDTCLHNPAVPTTALPCQQTVSYAKENRGI